MKALKRALTLSIILGLGLGLIACKSELDNKPAAKVVDTKKSEQPAKKADAKADDAKKPAAKAAAETLKVDMASSSLSAVGAKVTGDHTVTFKKFDGTMMIADGKATGVDFTVTMSDFDNEIEDAEFKKKLNGHLSGKDFFNVAENPTSTFKSKSIKESKSAAGTHEIEGDLTLRGKTVTVKFPATVKVEDKLATGTAQFTINRKDFGMEYPGKADDLIKDDVLIKLNFSFPRG